MAKRTESCGSRKLAIMGRRRFNKKGWLVPLDAGAKRPSRKLLSMMPKHGLEVRH